VRDLVIHRSGSSSVEGSSSILVTAEGDRARVEEVEVRHSYLGITVREAEDVTIAHVRIVGHGVITGELHAVSEEGHADSGEPAEARLAGDGVWLFNTIRATVRDSVIAHVRDGVYLTYGSEALIEGNRIEQSRYAVHDMYSTALTIRGNVLSGNLSGLVLMYGGPVSISGNVITDSGSPSTGFGVLIKDAGSVVLDANVIADNRVGLHIDDAGRTGGQPTTVSDNTIAMNQVGVLLFPSADSLFTRNGFVENSTQVTLGGQGSTQAVWSESGVGNYWSDYAGFDRAGDGRGDLPYERSGRIGQLIADEPVLLALASGPGIRLLSSMEDRWSPAEPLVRDPAPLTTLSSPPLTADRPSTAAPFWIPGAASVALGAWLMHRARGKVRTGG
jgi:nitrous oxidase accessory protein